MIDVAHRYLRVATASVALLVSACAAKHVPVPHAQIFFSIVQRKVLTPNDCTDLAAVEARLLDFQRRYEGLAKPFEWKFTRADLARLMARLEEKALAAAA